MVPCRKSRICGRSIFRRPRGGSRFNRCFPGFAPINVLIAMIALAVPVVTDGCLAGKIEMPGDRKEIAFDVIDVDVRPLGRHFLRIARQVNGASQPVTQFAFQSRRVSPARVSWACKMFRESGFMSPVTADDDKVRLVLSQVLQRRIVRRFQVFEDQLRNVIDIVPANRVHCALIALVQMRIEFDDAERRGDSESDEEE